MKNYAPALDAFQKFVKRKPDHPFAPNAYFFMAMLLKEQFNDKIKATEILQHLLAQYPFHENASFVEKYLKQMNA